MPRRLQQCFGPLDTLISTGTSETGVYEHSSNHIFLNRFLPTNWSYESNLFSKSWKFYVDFENVKKPPENVDGFEDNCIWTFWGSFCQLRQEYMWSAINVLKSGPNISDPSKSYDTQVNLFDINGRFEWNCCRADFSIVLDPLTR